MSSRDTPLLGGGFEPQNPPRAKSLDQARSLSQMGVPFVIRPGGSGTSVFEGLKTQTAYTTGKQWTQQVAVPSTGESTKYENIFPKIEVTDLTRANKSFVAGHSDMLSPQTGINNWRGKSYSDSGLLGASLIRVNETTTAFGQESMGSDTHDAGTGIMAEVLHQKWSAKSAGATLTDTNALRGHLETKFPQLVSVDKMRTQSDIGLRNEITDSRMMAAVSAGGRALDKGYQSWQVGEYVQRKFAKHGLGSAPGGWAQQLKTRRGL